VASESAILHRLAESVADGRTVDWAAAEVQAADEALIRQLRVLASVAVLHRSLPLDSRDWPRRSIVRRSSAAPAIGNWAHLALLERLGSGSFGDVYRAWDPYLEREVALKLLRADTSPEDLETSRIVQEGRLLARVRHSNVITVYGAAEHEGRVGLWMELVEGVTLEQMLQKHGPLSARETALLGIDLCRALAAIHAAGIIHRDVKAQNVMRENGGRIVLMDFGAGREIEDPASRYGRPSDFTGTPLYLAPEILTGAQASLRSDLYSLGVLLYHLTTANFPVRAQSFGELQDAHAQGMAVRLRDTRADLPTAFVRVVDRAIAPDPQRRHGSAGAFEADLVSALEDAPTETVDATPAGNTASRWFSRNPAATAAAVIAMLALGVALWSTAGKLWFKATPGPIRSVAVLPLVNLSGDLAQEYFADGMTDELIATLSRLDGLNVISRTSVVRFKGSGTPLPEIARTLDVDAVLEGSVVVLSAAMGQSTPKKRVRVNARLILASTDAQLWNKTFETEAEDVLTLQADIAKAVTDEVGLRFASGRAPRVTRLQNFDAFDLYLRGRSYWNLRTEEALKRSIQYFQEAVERGYLPAYTGLADAYNMLGVYGIISRADAASFALIAAEKALEYDESLGKAYASLGQVHMAQRQWDAADASFKRAIELEPGYPSSHQWYGDYLAQRGRLDEALVEMNVALTLDPLSTVINTHLGTILMLARRYDEAIRQFERALRLDPGFGRARVNLAESYMEKREYDRALPELTAAAATLGNDVVVRADLGYLFAKTGRREEALKIADELASRYQDRDNAAAGALVFVYTGLGENDQAFAWLDRAVAVDDPWMAYLKVEPRLDGLRRDPRFAQHLRSMSLQ
jgi:eukaryotic-like serine/threonine-protein kinase